MVAFLASGTLISELLYRDSCDFLIFNVFERLECNGASFKALFFDDGDSFSLNLYYIYY